MLLCFSTFPRYSDKLFWDVFSSFDRVVSQGITIPSFCVLCLVFLLYMWQNASSCIIAIGGNSVRALSFYQAFSILVVWIIEILSVVGRWVFRHCRFVYNVIVGDGIFDAMFVDADGMGLNADNAKQSFVAWHKFYVRIGGKLVCIFVYSCDKED